MPRLQVRRIARIRTACRATIAARDFWAVLALRRWRRTIRSRVARLEARGAAADVSAEDNVGGGRDQVLLVALDHQLLRVLAALPAVEVEHGEVEAGHRHERIRPAVAQLHAEARVPPELHVDLPKCSAAACLASIFGLVLGRIGDDEVEWLAVQFSHLPVAQLRSPTVGAVPTQVVLQRRARGASPRLKV